MKYEMIALRNFIILVLVSRQVAVFQSQQLLVHLKLHSVMQSPKKNE